MERHLGRASSWWWEASAPLVLVVFVARTFVAGRVEWLRRAIGGVLRPARSWRGRCITG
jgi:hypothetical protein